ncbi:hypothetical protein D3C77_817950 [compost metagenome]
MKQIHWTLVVGMLLGVGTIIARRLGLEIHDFFTGFVSAISIVFCINGIVQFGKKRVVVK